MPKGPNGQKRPADVIRNIVMVMRIATGEEQEIAPSKKAIAGKKGGKATAKAMSPAERQAAAKKAAEACWSSS